MSRSTWRTFEEIKHRVNADMVDIKKTGPALVAYSWTRKRSVEISRSGCGQTGIRTVLDQTLWRGKRHTLGYSTGKSSFRRCIQLGSRSVPPLRAMAWCGCSLPDTAATTCPSTSLHIYTSSSNRSNRRAYRTFCNIPSLTASTLIDGEEAACAGGCQTASRGHPGKGPP